VRGADDVRRFVHTHLRGRCQEVFMVLGLDSRRRIRLIKEVGLGSVAHVHVHPREVFRPLIQAGAHAVILVHNHPSGDPDPSESDIGLTHRLAECGWMTGIPVVDHIIVTDAGCTSMLALGLIPEGPLEGEPPP
jgi:DNA repair protein RadC